MMAMQDISEDSATKFDPFHVYSAVYKTVREHDVGLDVLVPKGLECDKSPIIVRFHGGFLARRLSSL